MSTAQLILAYLDYYEKKCMTNHSVDCVVFGYHEKQMKILCTQIIGLEDWLLPGGFIEKEEHLDDAAKRILTDRTGIEGIFLKQFYTFGSSDRSWKNKFDARYFQKETGISASRFNWFENRIISTGYYALTEFSKVVLTPNAMEKDCRWFDIDNLPNLMLDHADMVKKALVTLRTQIHSEPVGYNLLPEKFTLPELQALYETVLGKKIDHRNFTKKLISLGIIKKLKEKKHIGAHRAPSLYKFNKSNYNSALKDGIEFAF